MAAGSRPEIEVEGARELRRALKNMDGRLKDLKDTHQAAGELVASAARTFVPHVSGRLHDTIRTDRRAAGASVLAGRARVPYAGPIHFGWPSRGIEAQPFLYAAIELRRDEVAAQYVKAIDGLVRQLDREAP